MFLSSFSSYYFVRFSIFRGSVSVDNKLQIIYNNIYLRFDTINRQHSAKRSSLHAASFVEVSLYGKFMKNISKNIWSCHSFFFFQHILSLSRTKGVVSLDFISPTWGKMTLAEVSENLRSYLQEDAEAKYKIIIGTDSHTTQQHTVFVTALVIHRIGKGARFYFRRVKHPPIPDLRYRIYRETSLSLELIDMLKAHGISRLIEEWPIEVHLDIGQKGETRSLIQEIVGWVAAVGYEAKIKPNAFGASSAADRFTY